MFLARVVVGDFCQGKMPNMAPPRPRPGAIDSDELCDSTVDDETDPTIFVIYNDAQQYPEYLITFRLV
jgi:poly [ADP-ribose] polymerase 10/14/15